MNSPSKTTSFVSLRMVRFPVTVPRLPFLTAALVLSNVAAGNSFTSKKSGFRRCLSRPSLAVSTLPTSTFADTRSVAGSSGSPQSLPEKLLNLPLKVEYKWRISKDSPECTGSISKYFSSACATPTSITPNTKLNIVFVFIVIPHLRT